MSLMAKACNHDIGPAGDVWWYGCRKLKADLLSYMYYS